MNRIQLSEGFSDKTIDYVARCIGAKLSDQYPDCNIIGNVIKDRIRGVGVWDKEGSNTYAVFALISHGHIDNFLLVDRKVHSIYEAVKNLQNIDFQVYDIGNKKVFTFDTKCTENKGYNIDTQNLIFNTDYAKKTEDISGGDLLVLSMGIDSTYDAYGNYKE